jgi:iron complex transport system ATP-binding protein
MTALRTESLTIGYRHTGGRPAGAERKHRALRAALRAADKHRAAPEGKGSHAAASHGRGGRLDGALVIAEELDVGLQFGEVVCMVGPNGAGKSTLLRTLSGLQAALGGRTVIAGNDVRDLDLKARAKTIGVVLTEHASVGLLSAFELVSLGRHPHTDWAGRLTQHDRDVVEWALEAVGAIDLSHRPVHELSDGERQKIMIARALAQEPAIIILDEPTAFLDLPRRVEILGLLKDLARTTDRAVLLSTHDLDLAIRAADRLWLMSSAGTIHTGAPEDLVLSGELETVFAAEGVVFDPDHGSFHLASHPKGTIALKGDGLPAVWTRRALRRVGFEVTPNDAASTVTVEVAAEGSGSEWIVHRSGQSRRCTSIYEVVSVVTDAGHCRTGISS